MFSPSPLPQDVEVLKAPDVFLSPDGEAVEDTDAIFFPDVEVVKASDVLLPLRCEAVEAPVVLLSQMVKLWRPLIFFSLKMV